MKLVFLGTPPTAVFSLESLVEAGHEIQLVVTQPDRASGRSRDPVAPPVKIAALDRGLPVEQPSKIRTDSFRERVGAGAPDALVVVAYGRILPGPLLACGRLGAVNLHFSLLPRGRGAAPVQWTLARGEEVAGVTTMMMNEQLDEGDLLASRAVPIERGEHCPELQVRLARVGAKLLVETIAQLGSGQVQPRPQDPTQATYAPPLRKEDGVADFALSAREIEGRVRGFDPWPGVWATRSGKRLRIARAAAGAAARSPEPPGTVLELANEAFFLACGAGTVLEVRAVQPEGGRIMSARDAANGRVLARGDRLVGKPIAP